MLFRLINDSFRTSSNWWTLNPEHWLSKTPEEQVQLPIGRPPAVTDSQTHIPQTIAPLIQLSCERAVEFCLSSAEKHSEVFEKASVIDSVTFQKGLLRSTWEVKLRKWHPDDLVVSVSHRWADEKSTVRSTVYMASGASRTVAVNDELMQNLAALSGYGMPIWMDLFCINQTDADDVTAQVSIMGSIYLSSISLVTDHRLNWVHLPSPDFFSRAWVQQEFRQGSKLLLSIPPQHASPSDIALAVNRLGLADHIEIDDWTRHNNRVIGGKFSYIMRKAAETLEPINPELMAFTQSMAQKTDYTEVWTQGSQNNLEHWGLFVAIGLEPSVTSLSALPEGWAFRMTQLECSVPKDRMFGLLGVPSALSNVRHILEYNNPQGSFHRICEFLRIGRVSLNRQVDSLNTRRESEWYLESSNQPSSGIGSGQAVVAQIEMDQQYSTYGAYDFVQTGSCFVAIQVLGASGRIGLGVTESFEELPEKLRCLVSWDLLELVSIDVDYNEISKIISRSNEVDEVAVVGSKLLKSVVSNLKSGSWKESLPEVELQNILEKALSEVDEPERKRKVLVAEIE